MTDTIMKKAIRDGLIYETDTVDNDTADTNTTKWSKRILITIIISGVIMIGWHVYELMNPDPWYIRLIS